MDSKLYTKSIQKIKDSQSPWGSYVACATFPTYQFCWLRDGSFIAHAMDTVGEYDSAAAFFRWVGGTIWKYSHKVEGLRRRLEDGQPVGKEDVLHTRYSLDGNEVDVDNTWGNFQIDGYGTWLWALKEHVCRSGDTALLEELYAPVQTTLHYLELAWKLPNYDCWEEYPEYLHPYSLAAVYAGFQSAATLIEAGMMKAGTVQVEDLAGQVKDFILTHGAYDGQLKKHIYPQERNKPSSPFPKSGVDASLLGVSLPYHVLSPNCPTMRATVQAIESDLHRPGGGVYRYKADVYYGGGEWILLTAWLGWYYAVVGQVSQAEALCSWVEAQADEDGNLPEQVNEHKLAPGHYEPWVNKWGPVANPLTWSHAMYIILVNAIKESKQI
jgi:GH15 family glucan-1,4-alpha-glucosidase